MLTPIKREQERLEQQFSTRGSRPLLGGQPFHKGHLRPLENTDIYIMIHNRGENHSYEEAIKITLWLGVTTTWGTILKGGSVGKVENHWAREIAQWLKAHPVLREALSLVPSNHNRHLTTLYNSSPRGINAFFWPPRYLQLTWTYKDTHYMFLKELGELSACQMNQGKAPEKSPALQWWRGHCDGKTCPPSTQTHWHWSGKTHTAQTDQTAQRDRWTPGTCQTSTLLYLKQAENQ